MKAVMNKAKKPKASGDNWYQKALKEDPDAAGELRRKRREAEQARRDKTKARAAAAAAPEAGPVPVATAEAATSPPRGWFSWPSSSAGAPAEAQQEQPAAGGAPVGGGYTTAAALDGLRYPTGPSPKEVGYHGNEWAHLNRAHQLLGVQLLEPGLLREEQLERAAERLARGEAAFNIDEWAESSAAFLVYGDYDPLPDGEESLWGRCVIDDNFRFVGIHELAGVARASGMPSLMRGAGSLLQQVLPRAYATYADETASLVDDETEAHEALETAVEAMGFYINSVKLSKPWLAPKESLPVLIEKLTAAQARVNTLVDATVCEARALAAPSPPPPAAPACSARSPTRERSPAAAVASPTASASRSTRSSPSSAAGPSEKALGKRRTR